MKIDVTVSEWGNSLAVRLPKDIAARIGAKKGGHLSMRTTAEGDIILTPKKHRKHTIESLMKDMTPETLRQSMSAEEWGLWQRDVGREVVKE